MQVCKIVFGIEAAALACALASPCARGQAPASAHRCLPAAGPVSGAASGTVEVVREIDDPHTGDRWLLVRDWNCPGGPGRLLLLAGSPHAAQPAPDGKTPPAAPDSGLAAPAAPVIHAGDALVVEENSPVVEARLAATALGPAVRDAIFEARLEIGGKIVRVRALAPGRATLEPALLPQTGAQP